MNILRRFALVALVLLVLAPSPAPATAQTTVSGAAIVNVGAPSASNGTITAAGNVAAGSAKCGGASTGGIGGLCNCCPPPAKETGDWKTCQIQSVSYTLSGPTSRSGTASITGTSNTPAGCTLECSPVGTGQCQQSKDFSINETGLPAGDYTLTVTSTDCKGVNSSSQTVTMPATLAGSCSVSPSSVDVNESAVWSASASGGTGTYSYSWSGTDGLSSVSRTVTKSYGTSGSKTGTVKITSGSSSLTKSCTLTVNQGVVSELRATCSPNKNPAQTNETVTWTVQPTGGTGAYSYSWSGNGTFPTGATATSVNATYSATGTKNANVVVRSGTDSITASCSTTVVVPPDTTIRGTVNVASNLPTTWQMFGPGGTASQTSQVTASTSPNQPGGTYSIQPAAISGYTVAYTPAQTIDSAGSTISFNVTYTATSTGTSGGTSTTTSTTLPFIDLKINGIDGPATVASGTAASLTWSTFRATSCWAAAGPWSGSRSVSNTTGESTGAVTSSRTYMLGCQNSYGAVYDSVTVNVSTAPPNTLAGGSHDANYNASCQVLGWAADADTKSQDIKIRIYSDGTYIKEATASQYRSDLETAGVCTGGTCGFAESISGLITSGVAHSITVKAIDAQTGQEASLGATPKNITCPVPTTGNVVVTSNLPTVWKLSGPSGTQNQTASSTGATYSATQTGIYTIAGIPSISGYKAPVVSPASSQTLSTGETRTFTITYEAEAGASGGTLSCAPSNQAAGPGDAVSFSATGGSGTTFSWTAAGGAPSSQSGTDPTFATAYSGSGLKTVMVTRGTEQASCTVSVSTTGNNLPDGTHDTNDNASCLVMGWTADPDDRSTDLSVRIYSDGSLVKTVTANKYRSDLTGVCTGGTCSFSESLTGLITAGVSHAVTVKSVDGQTGQESTLVSSPRSITCPSAASDYDILSSNNIEIDLRRGTKSSPTTITVDPLNGFASAVPLTARSSSPELSSAVYTLSDPSLAAAEYSRGSALTVTVGAGTPTGSYPITVEGVADGKIRTANITLRIIGKIQDFREI